MIETRIRGGLVVDGSGRPGRRGDVAIRDTETFDNQTALAEIG
jgi:N-acyl-D-aspartate/D-glutamate deacylase